MNKMTRIALFIVPVLLIVGIALGIFMTQKNRDAHETPETGLTSGIGSTNGSTGEMTRNEATTCMPGDETKPPIQVEIGIETRGEDEEDYSSGKGTAPTETVKPTTKPDDITQPSTEQTPGDTTVPATKPEEATKPGNQEQLGVPQLNYQQYMALSADEQQNLYDAYFADDPLAFASWFKRIKKEYDDENPSIIVTGPIDIGDYINP